MSPLAKQALYALSTALANGTVYATDLLAYFAGSPGAERGDMGFGNSERAFIGAARTLCEAVRTDPFDPVADSDIGESDCLPLLLVCEASTTKVSPQLSPWLQTCAKFAAHEAEVRRIAR